MRVCDFGATDTYGRSNIVGPPEQTLFLGCTVLNFNVNLGWNEQASSISVNLIEDECSVPDGKPPKMYYDRPGKEEEWTGPDPGFEAYTPAIGAPVYFRFGDFEFAGVVQSWMKKDSSSGMGLYTVNISDPRFILQNTQIILNGDRGSVRGSFNVINPFGWLEGVSFGCSDVNDLGVPWSHIKVATATLLSNSAVGNTWSPYNSVCYRSHNWSSPSTTEGFGLIRSPDDTFDSTFVQPNLGNNGWYSRYYVDISDIPFAPTFYRLKGETITLSDMISQVCLDAGCDYFVELFITSSKEKVIKIVTQQRRTQPSIGKIEDFVNNPAEIPVVSRSNGRELRNEPTSSFTTGANHQEMHQTAGFSPWWGYDSEGNIMTWGTMVSTEGFGAIYFVNLDVRPLNLALTTGLGSNFIVVNETEMRAALEGHDSWFNYALQHNNGAGTATGVWLAARGFKPTWDLPGVIGVAGANNRLKAIGAALLLEKFADVVPNEQDAEDMKKIFEYISKYTDDFYGKQALIDTPIQNYFNDEQAKLIYEGEYTSEAWVEPGDPMLGTVNQDVRNFYIQESQMLGAGVRFGGVFVKDDGSTITDGTWTYTKAEVDSEHVLDAFGNDHAIVRFDQIAEEDQEAEVDDKFAGMIAVGVNRGGNPIDLKAVVGNFMAGIGPDVAFPLARRRDYPNAYAVPIRWNYDRYGAWAFIGPPGGVELRNETEFAPWVFGDTATLQLVASASMDDSITFMQVGERGSVTWVGYPKHRIGEELRYASKKFKDFSIKIIPWNIGCTSGNYSIIDLANQAKGTFGPNVTSIAVNISEQGFTTTYELSTFTPSFGRMSKINSDRIRSAAKTRVMLSKLQRQQNMMKTYTSKTKNKKPSN